MKHPARLTNNRLTEGFGPWSDVWTRSGWHLQIHCVSRQARIVDPARAIVHLGPPADCQELIGRRAPTAGRARAAILLHGILNYPGIMNRLAGTLAQLGWTVANLALPARAEVVEAGVRFLEGKSRKAFFFAKKKQKTFVPRLPQGPACFCQHPDWQNLRGRPRRREQKSFASFLQKNRPCLL